MNIDVESSCQLSVDINRCHEGLEIDGDDKKFIPSLFIPLLLSITVVLFY